MRESVSKVLELKVGKVKTSKLLNNTRDTLVSAIKKETIVKSYLTKVGFKDDEQADTVHHGGENKALFIFSALTFKELNEHFKESFDIHSVATFGENLILSDICEKNVCVGDVYEIGESIVQVTQPRQPCWKLNANTKQKDMTKHCFKNGLTGWYAKVLKEGFIKKDDEVILQKKGHKNLTIAKLNKLIVNPLCDEDATKEALLCEDLGGAFLASLTKRYTLRDKDDQFLHYQT